MQFGPAAAGPNPDLRQTKSSSPLLAFSLPLTPKDLLSDNFCLFHKNNKLMFGLIIGQKKTKLSISPVQGREFSASQSQLFYSWQANCPSDLQGALTLLKEKEASCNKNAAEIDLATIHELTEAGTAYQVDDLAEDFLDDPNDPWQKVTLLIALVEEKLLFHQKKGNFTPRSAEEIETLVAEEAQHQINLQRQELEASWAGSLREAIKPEIPAAEEEHWQQFIKRLEHFLRFWGSSQEKDLFTTLFHIDPINQRSSEHQVLACLATAGRNLSWGKLILLRQRGELEFSEEEISLSQEIIQNYSATSISTTAKPARKDLQELDTWTVDSASTKDFDDALSLQTEGENTRIWVHIADVASQIRPEGPLFSKAEERVASIYTPKGTCPMFEPRLSEDHFSLIEQQAKPAVTFEFLVGPEGEILTFSFYPSLIQVNKNETYDQVNLHLEEGNQYWCDLNRATEQLSKVRHQQGALSFPRTEIKLNIDDPAKILVKGVRSDTKASLIIQELAVLTNHHAALYCQEHELGCLYRNQAPYSFNKELQEGETPRLEDIRFQSAKLATEPTGHSALGLNAYTQATSPIRRFQDLVCQTQLLHHLQGGENLFTTEQIEYWASNSEEESKKIFQAERTLTDHWKVKYLSQNLGVTYQAKVLREMHNGQYLIKILDLDYALVMPLSNNEGDIHVQVEYAQPEIGRIELRQIS